jgi:hypothetical protein
MVARWCESLEVVYAPGRSRNGETFGERTGIIGEYLGRIYERVKRRPPSILDSTLGFDDASPSARLDETVGTRPQD